ncbi:hypothetical protein EV360DRAFT_71249 [Lentinula raphanica]|nr:hypothetical protein EV360DRAFT_71249 [Lentinula raphanica]
MLPQNTVLAAYLLTIPGLLYSKTPRFAFSVLESSHPIPTAASRTDLALPIHSPIDDPASIVRILQEPTHLDQYPPNTWIKCKRGLYQNDVGLTTVDHFDEIDLDVERLVLFPPRIDWDSVPDFSSGSTSLKRKRNRTERPDILPREAGEFIAQNYNFPTRMDCARHCKAPDSCTHSEEAHKRYVCLGNQWQNGLVLIRIKLRDMELASEIPVQTRYYFLASNHSAVQQSLSRMPSPSAWEFRTGEAVRFTDFNGVWCIPDGHYTFELPKGRTEGVIHYVGPSFCEIEIALEDSNGTVKALHAMSKVHLEKIFHPGDTVLLLPGARRKMRSHFENDELESGEIELTGKEGLVISAGPAKVEVLLEERHNEVEQSITVHDALPYHQTDKSVTAPELSAHQHTSPSDKPFTAQNPWKNMEVYPVKYSNKGYRAVVVDARRDTRSKSGLLLQIRYEAQGMSNSSAWVDYHFLRRVDNDRFLHDDYESYEGGSHIRWGPYWRPKPGYCPEYTVEEERARKRRKLREDDSLAEEPIRATTPCSFSPNSPISDPAWDPSSPDPPSQHWILDPRIVEGLQDSLELLVATKDDPKQDRQVFIRSVDNVIGVYTNTGNRRKLNEATIVEVDPWTILQKPRSYSIPPNPAIAKALYIVCSGERTGVLCRRVSHMTRLETDRPPLWLVQAVKLIRKPKLRKGTQFNEVLDTDLGTFWVESQDLATVHETKAMRNVGNQVLEPIRRLHQPVHES